MNQTTDFVLFQVPVDKVAQLALFKTCMALCEQSHVPMTLSRVAWSPDTRTAYIYAQLHERTTLSKGALYPMVTAIQRSCSVSGEVRASRLESVFVAEGISSQETPVFHYVVEMDPDVGWMPEITRWYDTEHMPGLAAVPGCVSAMRLLNHDYGPLSLACYDLVTQDTLGSPSWLAVRGTAWSDITRPHFTNTKRTMFEVMS